MVPHLLDNSKEINDYIELSKYIYSVLYNFIFEYPKHTAEYIVSKYFRVIEYDKYGQTTKDLTTKPRTFPERELQFNCIFGKNQLFFTCKVVLVSNNAHYNIWDEATDFNIYEIGQGPTNRSKDNHIFYINGTVSQMCINRKKYFRIKKQCLDKDELSAECTKLAKNLYVLGK